MLAIQAGNPGVYWRLNECYRQLNLLDEAFNILREGIKLHPKYGNLHFSLIINLLHIRRTQEVISSAIAASAEIARRVPQATFVFLRGGLLQQRLSRAFAAVGLNSKDYCVFLTIAQRLDYLMINLLSDVYLDTFTWSGGNTTLEAIACNLPIVTCPREFMRGRHSYSFLKMLGVTDTIAENEAEYIE